MQSRLSWAGLSVGTKVILPFVALLMLVSALVSWFATQAVSAASQAATSSLALREADTVNADLATFGDNQATLLRQFTSTPGLDAALKADNIGPVTRNVLFPLLTNQQPDPLRLVLLDVHGRELLHAISTPEQGRCTCTSGRTLLPWPHVRDVLAGRPENRALTYVGVVNDQHGPMLYTVGPVDDASGVVGAVILGEPLSYLAGRSRARAGFDLVLYDSAGNRLAGTTNIPVPPHPERTSHQEMSFGGQPVEVFAFPWLLRGVENGHALVMVPAAAAGASQNSLPVLLAGIFGGALVLTVMVGLFITRTLTRPLGTLVRGTDEVAAGNLRHRVPVGSGDEIGRLTGSFNRMTETLERSAAQIAANAEATVETLAAAIDARDPYTHGHSMRVMRYSVELARAAGLDEPRVEMIRRGCMVHDIGKIGVRDSVLGKPGPLSAPEEAQMRLHPEIGHSMLRHLDWDPMELGIVLHHHERWDGSGYPHRLAGEEIPQLARLVSVADTLDAMTSSRPYRRAHSFETAATEIRRLQGSQFDPAAVAAFDRATTRLQALLLELAPSDPADVVPMLDVVSS